MHQICSPVMRVTAVWMLLLAADVFGCETYSLLGNTCTSSAGRHIAKFVPTVTAVEQCVLLCSNRASDCLGCSIQNPGGPAILIDNSSAWVSGGDCSTVVRQDVINRLLQENCPVQRMRDAPFLVELNQTEEPMSLSSLLCSRQCRQVAADGSEFASSLSATASSPASSAEPANNYRCIPLSTPAYFDSAASSASPLAVSLLWRSHFTNESCSCAAHHASLNSNVPAAVLLAWSPLHRLDVCGHSCISRPGCEFFVFNDTGCYEGSLSVYLNSRNLGGGSGCVIWHRLRSWAPSMLAFYTFNSSLLNLADPAVMPAVNNTPLDVNSDGVRIPLSLTEFVKLDLTQIGFDPLVRANTNFTFVFSFSRTVRKSRSELALFARCDDNSRHNGAINEQSTGNQGWFLNSLTGKWLVVESGYENSSYMYPEDSTIHLAVAIGPTSGYFIVNGIRLPTTEFYTQDSTYGTDPVELGCLYLGFNYMYIPERSLHGRVKVLGIFTKLLSLEEVMEIV